MIRVKKHVNFYKNEAFCPSGKFPHHPDQDLLHVDQEVHTLACLLMADGIDMRGPVAVALRHALHIFADAREVLPNLRFTETLVEELLLCIG